MQEEVMNGFNYAKRKNILRKEKQSCDAVRWPLLSVFFLIKSWRSIYVWRGMNLILNSYAKSMNTSNTSA